MEKTKTKTKRLRKAGAPARRKSGAAGAANLYTGGELLPAALAALPPLPGRTGGLRAYWGFISPCVI
jgi:hypothetical protein